MKKGDLTRSGFTLISKACKGFTLIELLVVISIIGILATLLAANLVGVRERGRDAQRKMDVAQIQRALELYKSTQNPPSYPTTSGWEDALEDTANGGVNAVMKTVPHDPKCTDSDCSDNWADYVYTRGADTLQYTLQGCLENKSDTAKDSVQTTCPAACRVTFEGVCYTRTEP